MRIPQLASVLRVNAAFSALSGTAAIVLALAVDEPLGLDARVLLFVGIGLVGYGSELGLWSRRDDAIAATARFATTADVLWVIGAGFVLGALPASLDTTGRLLLGGTSLLVAELAVLQYLGLRRMISRITPVSR